MRHERARVWLPTLQALKLFGRKAAAAVRRGDALVRPTYINTSAH